MSLVKKMKLFTNINLALIAVIIVGCAQVNVPDSRNVKIPSPVSAEQRKEAVNERPDSVMYLPLGQDVLVPEKLDGDRLPTERIGPFELRGETLAGALQLILADYDVAIAFETEQGLTRKVTVANLSGELGKVVSRVCSLADLYCSYDDGVLTVKDTQTFTVVLPPLGGVDGETTFIDNIVEGLTAIVGEDVAEPIADTTTRTIIYTATQRTSTLAENYFQRLRANTAMIVFETYIWEVSLNSGNSTGIDWDKMKSFGKFNTNIGVNGSIGADFTNPVSIGLPTTQAIGATPADLVQFLAQFGALKTISQPQITVLSGASAELRVADTENYVSEISTTITDGSSTTSVNTGSVDSGFTLSVGSSWDKSTVYADIGVNLTNVNEIEDFTFSDGGAGGTSTTIQLPQTSERELTTQIRVRPGDSVLIAGLVRENDNFSSRGPGFMEPLLPDSRTAQTQNLELVILLRPRVIVYTASDDARYLNYSDSKNRPVAVSAPIVPPRPPVVTRDEFIEDDFETRKAPRYILPKAKPRVQKMPLAPVETPRPKVIKPIVVEPPRVQSSIQSPIKSSSTQFDADEMIAASVSEPPPTVVIPKVKPMNVRPVYAEEPSPRPKSVARSSRVSIAPRINNDYSGASSIMPSQSDLRPTFEQGIVDAVKPPTQQADIYPSGYDRGVDNAAKDFFFDESNNASQVVGEVYEPAMETIEVPPPIIN